MRALALATVLVGAACAPTPASSPPRASQQPPSARQQSHPQPPPSAEPATRLRTRVHRYAVYVAQMHRLLHEHWADRYLRSLDARPATDPLNDTSLAVELSISIGPTGAVNSVDVVGPSRSRDFDRAAVNAFVQAAPFPPPPDSIRSSDGLVHLRWTLHRDQRECAAAGVHPIVH